MTDLPTHYESSDGTKTPIRDLENGHLHNAFRKRSSTPNDPTTLALRAEVLRRSAASPGPASQAPGANNPPPVNERKDFEDRLGADNARLVLAAAALEARAANLPKVVETDADVAAIDAWIREAAELERRTEKDREAAKAPWLMRGQVVDAFFGGIKRALSSRTPGLEQRKRPYLIAKRRREEEEQRQREAAERQAAEEQRQRQEEERQRAAEAQRRADEAAETLRQAEARRAAEEAAANAQAEADDAAPDLTLATDLAGDVDDAEVQLREAHHALDQHTSAADSAGEAAREADRRAQAAADGSHALPKVASSSLVAVWRHRFTSPREFDKSLGPLGPFLKEAELLDGLTRAAKADPRPVIPGVEWYEDFDVKTDKRARGPGNAGDARHSF
jgi:hypothetical protein